jgi:hypothetical protein
MTSKVKRTINISSESDYEIHRLAKLWGAASPAHASAAITSRLLATTK